MFVPAPQVPNNLGEALNLWNTFRSGGTIDQQKQQMAQGAEALAAAKTANAVNSANAGQTLRGIGNVSGFQTDYPGAVDQLLNPTPVTSQPFSKLPMLGGIPGVGDMQVPTGETTPATYSAKSLPFWSQDPNIASTAQKAFPHVTRDALPQVWNNFVTNEAQTRKAPYAWPDNFNVFGSGLDDPTPYTSQPLEKLAPTSPVIEPLYKPDGTVELKGGRLSAAQLALLTRYPQAVRTHIPAIQQEVAQNFVNENEGRVKTFQEQAAANSPIRQWFGAGDSRGMQQMVDKIDAIVKPHLGPDGNLATPLTGSEAKDLVYTTGAIDNPGKAVVGGEFDNVFKSQGWLDSWKGKLQDAQNGNGMSPALTMDIYKLTHSSGDTVKQRAYNNLDGIATAAEARGVPLERLVPDPTARKDFQNWKGIQNAVPVADQNEALKLAPGSYAKLPSGQVFRVKADSGTGTSPAAPSGNPALPPVQLGQVQPPAGSAVDKNGVPYSVGAATGQQPRGYGEHKVQRAPNFTPTPEVKIASEQAARLATYLAWRKKNEAIYGNGKNEPAELPQVNPSNLPAWRLRPLP